MEEIVNNFVHVTKELVLNNNIFLSMFVGVFIIVLESVIPILPLAVFIAINMIAFGTILGFILSLFATILGCTISFFIFKKLRPHLLLKLKPDSSFRKFMLLVDNVSFSKLVVIMTIPFTPAFSINIAAGLSNMRYREYFIALLISKTVLVYFWGFVGTTLVQSVTDISVIIKIVLLILIAFILSKVVIKKFDIK